jgi:hypothetical protein
MRRLNQHAISRAVWHVFADKVPMLRWQGGGGTCRPTMFVLRDAVAAGGDFSRLVNKAED